MKIGQFKLPPRLLLCVAACAGLAANGTAAPESETVSSPVPTAHGVRDEYDFQGEAVEDELPALYRLPDIGAAPVLPSPNELASGFAHDIVTLPSTDGVPRPPIEAWMASDPHSEPWAASHAPPAFLYNPAPEDLTSQLLPAVRRGYALAQRGAVYAAQAEFVQVLRRVAQTKDAERGNDLHSRALADGLRALDEAKDFVPAGTQLEGELDVRIVASSHRTPIVRDRHDRVMPHAAVALYHAHAQEQLTFAIDGEQAGSMVLHGLGKVHARIADRDDNLHARRSAMTMYMAAVAACPTNHLAANELGVLLCRNGHAAEAVRIFEQTLDLSPTATTYHNLAMAQEKLGLHGQAAANEQESHRLARVELASGVLSKRAGIEWVSPQEMAGTGATPPQTSPAYNSQVSTPPAGQVIVGNAPLPTSRWQRTKNFAKSLPLPGKGTELMEPAPHSTEQIARPMPPPTPNGTQWR